MRWHTEGKAYIVSYCCFCEYRYGILFRLLQNPPCKCPREGDTALGCEKC